MRIHKAAVVSAAAIAAVMSVAIVANASPPAGNASGAGGAYAPVCVPSGTPGVAHCSAIQLLNPATTWQGVHVPGATPDKALGKGHGGGPPPPTSSTTTTSATTTTLPVASPSGYYPADIQSAYQLSGAIGAMTGSPTVAIVDAYDDPSAATDLAVYRSNFKLPQCGTGCFTKVGESGSTTNLPRANSSWSEEISLDLDMVSATCPSCKILLVEANSASIVDLGTAVKEAVSLGAIAVSNSYGASEYSGETASDSYYNHAKVAITVSAGDSGYGVEYPAASPYVTAVGGTTLTHIASGTRDWTETVWSGTGSGCSAYELAPTWQFKTSLCSMRTVADVSADANPSTGVAVYDTYGKSGWMVFGGTSVASPIIASIYALAGNASSFTISAGASTAAAGLYGAALNKVTSGTNANNCTTYLCNAADRLSPSGYNGPTGNGTPIGTTGF
jgi:subtilase family serine protease